MCIARPLDPHAGRSAENPFIVKHGVLQLNATGA